MHSFRALGPPAVHRTAHGADLHVAQALLRARQLARGAASGTGRAGGRAELRAALLQRRQRGLARLARLALLRGARSARFGIGVWAGACSGPRAPRPPRAPARRARRQIWGVLRANAARLARLTLLSSAWRQIGFEGAPGKSRPRSLLAHLLPHTRNPCAVNACQGSVGTGEGVAAC
jgi:hypothetical protein